MTQSLEYRMMSNLLGALWLRPESALWYGHMLAAVRRILGDNIQHPFMEFGCMDGVNTHVLLGGELGESFDVFSDVIWDTASHTRSTLKDDYFDTIKQSEKEIEITKKPSEFVDIAIDWKESHIIKSKRLDLFRRFVLWTPGETLGEINDGSIETIWAPNIYWMDDVSQIMKEFHRILSDTGRVVTIGPDKKVLDSMWYKYAGAADESWLRDLDRGRFINASKNSRTYIEWESLFKDSGLLITGHDMFIPFVVGQVYDVGFRPMFPVFMNMYEKLQAVGSREFSEIKSSWVQTLRELLAPLCNTEWIVNSEKVWHVFELRKSEIITM
jgi:hypothetical protein